MKFHATAWTSNWYTNRVDCVIKDPEGNDKMTVEGYYTSEIVAKDLETQTQWVLFKAPESNGCEDPFNNCSFNGWSLKVN